MEYQNVIRLKIISLSPSDPGYYHFYLFIYYLPLSLSILYARVLLISRHFSCFTFLADTWKWMWYPVKQWILLLYLLNQIWSWYHYAEKKLANTWVGGLVYTHRLACGLKHLGHFEPLVHAFKQKDNEQLVLIAYFIVAAVSKLNSLSFPFHIVFARLVKVLLIDWAFIIK